MEQPIQDTLGLMEEKLSSLKKNEDSLGTEINLPKYAKAYNKLLNEAADLVNHFYVMNTFRMFYRPEIDNGRFDSQRKLIAKKYSGKLNEAFRKRDVAKIENVTDEASREINDVWYQIVFPLIKDRGGII